MNPTLRARLGVLGAGGPAMLGDDPLMAPSNLAPVAIPAPVPVQAAPAQTAPRGRGFNVGDLLDEVFLDGAMANRRAKRDAQAIALEDREVALEERARRKVLAARLFPDDPVAQSLYATGNTKFMESLGGNYGATTVKDDEDLVVPATGKQVHRNAKTTQGVDGGRTYTIEDGKGAWGERRGESYAEANDRVGNEIDAETNRIRRELGLAGIDVRRTIANRPRADADKPPTQSGVVGAVLDKIAEEGLEALTPGELAIWDRYKSGPENGGMWPGFTPPAPAATPPPAPQPTPKPAPGGIARPTSKAELDKLAPGTLYINPADGKQYKKR